MDPGDAPFDFQRDCKCTKNCSQRGASTRRAAQPFEQRTIRFVDPVRLLAGFVFMRKHGWPRASADVASRNGGADYVTQNQPLGIRVYGRGKKLGTTFDFGRPWP